jgi:hypothetical protein
VEQWLRALKKEGHLANPTLDKTVASCPWCTSMAKDTVYFRETRSRTRCDLSAARQPADTK